MQENKGQNETQNSLETLVLADLPDELKRKTKYLKASSTELEYFHL